MSRDIDDIGEVEKDNIRASEDDWEDSDEDFSEDDPARDMIDEMTRDIDPLDPEE